MERVRVVADAVDPITSIGMFSALRARADIEVLPDVRLPQAHVFVLAADVVTSEVIARLRHVASCGPARTVLVTNQFAQHHLMHAIEYGLSTVLCRATVTPEKLASTVVSTWRGKSEFPSELLSGLLCQVERLQRDVLKPRGLTASGLSEREIDMLRLLAEGWDTKEIARKLSYSERTVKSMVQTVVGRFQLRNRTHAVAYAMRAGMI